MSIKTNEITGRVTHTRTQVEFRNSLGLVDIYQNNIDKENIEVRLYQKI